MNLRTIYNRAGERAVLLCPPHPKYGGSMYDVRLERISRKLILRRISTLRFDYRSVEKAVEDAKICFECLKERHGSVGVLGYSFGSVIASHICGNAIALLSPFRRIDGYELRDCDAPKLVVIAKRDQFISLRDSLSILGLLSEPKRVVILETDHFYTGKFDVLSDIVAEFFDSNL